MVTNIPPIGIDSMNDIISALNPILSNIGVDEKDMIDKRRIPHYNRTKEQSLKYLKECVMINIYCILGENYSEPSLKSIYNELEEASNDTEVMEVYSKYHHP